MRDLDSQQQQLAPHFTYIANINKNIHKMSEEIDKKILQLYQPTKKIGSGAYGHVWKVIDRKNNTVHALKKNFDAFQNEVDAQRTYREIMFLQQLRHPNIISLEKIIKAQNDKDVYLTFEFMDIDLYSLIRENILGEKHKRYIIYQVAKALYYLHSADLLHRDIKPSNVLVNESCLAKVCDFGLVRSVSDQFEPQVNPILTEYIATRWYRAPEILLGSKKYSKAIDVWSFGCLLGEMVKGKPFFPGSSTLNQIERVLMWTGPPSLADIKSLKTDFGREMLDLLSKIKPLNKAEWLPSCPSDAMDLLLKTLDFNPDKRYSMLSILKHPYLQEFFRPEDLIVPQAKITTQVNDNEKLTLEQYRALIYEQINQQHHNPGLKRNNQNVQRDTAKKSYTKFQKTSVKKNDCLPTQKTLYKNRAQKQIRSASKEKEDTYICRHPIYSRKNSMISGNSMNIMKKYESLLGKNKDYTKKKCIKTQEDAANYSNYIQKKDTSNMVRNAGNERSGQIIRNSGHEKKKQSEMIGRYMYKNRYI